VTLQFRCVYGLFRSFVVLFIKIKKRGYTHDNRRKNKILRTEKGITQEALAENLNVSRSAIAKWETNSGVPEVGNLIIISKLFDISVDELIDYFLVLNYS
jgi:DNA-binding XRE family transcriptional regulator